MFEDYKGVYALCAGPMGQSKPAKILKVFYTKDDCLNAASADPKYNNLEGIRCIPVPAYSFGDYGIIPYATFDDVYNLYYDEFAESSLDYDELEQCFTAGEAGVPWEEFVDSLERDGVYGEDIDVAADCYDCGQDHIAEGAEIKFTPGAEITAEDEIYYLDEERAALGESVNRSKMMKSVEKNMFNDINRTENGSLNEARNNLYDDTYKPDFKKSITVNTVSCNEVMCDSSDAPIIKAIDNLATMAYERDHKITSGWEYFADIADACGVSFYVVTDPAFAEGEEGDLDTDGFLASTFE